MSSGPQTITVGELRMHLQVFPDEWDLFFGNGNLHFYRTKARGEQLVQIEFDQDTSLLSEQRWTRVEERRPDSPDAVAVICRQKDGGLLRLTGFYDQGQWVILADRDKFGLVAVTHWCYLPEDVPEYRRDDPIS